MNNYNKMSLALFATALIVVCSSAIHFMKKVTK